MRLEIVLIVIHLSILIDGINWNGKDWAMQCDFRGKDLKNVRIRGEDCGGQCVKTQGCTHFAWTPWQGGTCWLKKGGASKKDAIASSDPKSVCGIVKKDSQTK